jgi:putative FmdB family regulatory protein
MPTYEYECTSCGNTFEAFQSMSEEPLRTCPECGQSVKRVIGGGMGIIFKGSGFYKNDSRASSSAGEKKEAAPAACACCSAKSGEACPAAGS